MAAGGVEAEDVYKYIHHVYKYIHEGVYKYTVETGYF